MHLRDRGCVRTLRTPLVCLRHCMKQNFGDDPSCPLTCYHYCYRQMSATKQNSFKKMDADSDFEWLSKSISLFPVLREHIERQNETVSYFTTSLCSAELT